MGSRDRLLVAAALATAGAVGGCETNDDVDTPATTSIGPSAGAGGVGTGAGGGTGGTGTGGISDGGGGFGGGDTCPTAVQVALATGSAEVYVANTCVAADDYFSFCNATGAAPDIVYAVTLQSPGPLTVSLDDGDGFDGLISVRLSQCDTRAANDKCVNLTVADGEKYAEELAAGTYHVVIEGTESTCGDYTVSFSMPEGYCGDGVVNDLTLGEECDPGEPWTDTCYAVDDPMGTPCTLKPTDVLLDVCPGAGESIDNTYTVGNKLVLGPYNTSAANSNEHGTCFGGNPGGRDQVFHFVADDAGTVRFRVGWDIVEDAAACDGCVGPPFTCVDGGPCWSTGLYARKGACNGQDAVEVICSSFSSTGNTWSSIDVPVSAGEEFWIFVDSHDTVPYTAGSYYLEGWYP